jgi:hypothetical protein
VPASTGTNVQFGLPSNGKTLPRSPEFKRLCNIPTGKNGKTDTLAKELRMVVTKQKHPKDFAGCTSLLDLTNSHHAITPPND